MYVVSAHSTSDDSGNMSTLVQTSSSLNGRQSWTVVIVYVMLTTAGLSVIAFLLLPLDVIFSRRSTASFRSAAQFAACCFRRRSVRPVCNADKVKPRARSLSMLTPLVIYIGVLDAFVSCDFTEVC